MKRSSHAAAGQGDTAAGDEGSQGTEQRKRLRKKAAAGTEVQASLLDDLEDDVNVDAPGSTRRPRKTAKKLNPLEDDSDADDDLHKEESRRAQQQLVVTKEETIAMTEAAAAVEKEEEEEEEDAEEVTGSEADGEGNGNAAVNADADADAVNSGTQQRKKKVKGNKGPISKIAKIDGVGSLAIKAAAEHGSFDLNSLVTWSPGSPVPFSFLADTFEAIAEESKRLVITGLLVNTFRAVIATTPEDLLPMVYLCTNRVAPAHAGVELGIGDAMLMKSLAQATGRKEPSIKADYDKCGDLGVVAAAARATQKTMFSPPPLTVRGVFKAFKDIAEAEGTKSQDRKRGMIVKLLVSAKQNEAGYLLRALQGKLRIGLAEQTVLVALAHATLLQREQHLLTSSGESLAGALEEAAQTVKAVYSECPSYDELVPALLSLPIDQLRTKVHFKPGVPIKPMLAKPTTGVSEVLDKFSDQPFTCEYKYDGERAQIHIMEDGSVKIYSRNSEDNTGKYPDIAALFPQTLAPGVKSLVIDAEAVAWNPVTKKLQPFQVLSTRARKDVSLESITVPVCVFAFDCLYLDGKVLLQEPLTVRREALYKALVPSPGKLEFATAKVSSDIDELSRFLDEAVEASTEGLIVKTLADSYEPSKRSSHWLKLKKDYLEGVGDTFDLVPIGAWYGKGKRTGVFGSYLLAIWDADREEYQTITKIGTGFSEELLKQLADTMREAVVPQAKRYYRFPDTLTPDVWFEPKAVWEVKAADLSISPVHKAASGLVDETKGISIRFPRLVRVREDKGPEDSTSPQQVAEMYSAQAAVAKGRPPPQGDDEY